MIAPNVYTLDPVQLTPQQKWCADWARANGQGIDPALILAFIEQESAFNPRAFLADRNGGSFGLCQLDLPTAQDRGFSGTPDQLYDPSTNLQFGVAQLLWIRKQLANNGGASVEGIAAAYNEGLTAALRQIPDPIYVAGITAKFAKWQTVLARGYQ